MRSSSRDAPGVPRRPTPEEFSSGAVQRAVLKETTQHPATILPIALGIAGGLATLVTREPLVFLGTLGLLGTGAATWVWNYFGRGEILAQRRVQYLRQQQALYDDWRQRGLDVRCREVSWGEGVKELHELRQAYQAAKAACANQNDRGETIRFEILADQGLEEGLQLVERGILVHQALAGINVNQLNSEVARWQKDRSRCRTDRECAAIDRKIETHQGTLTLHAQRSDSLHEIVASLNAIGNALEQVSLAAPGSSLGELFVTGGAASQLELAVRAASTVEERLRTLGDSSEMDRQALEAARTGRASQ